MEIKAPNNIVPFLSYSKKIFLGGTIDNGQSENWQENTSKQLQSEGWVVFNPRRDNWNSDLETTIENLKFYKQVNWELNAINCADLVLLYFARDSKSPITLLELGLMANSGKVVVCCDPKFWRRGNVEIICEKFNIPMYEYIDSFLNYGLSKFYN